MSSSMLIIKTSAIVVMVASISNDDDAGAADLYNIVIKYLIITSAICPSMEFSEHFDSLVNCEVLEGMND
jgi:hypothetical protein